MLIFINTTIFSNIPSYISNIQLLKGYSPGIEFPKLISLPLKQTSCIWFKSLFIEFFVVDMNKNMIEWKIRNDHSTPFPKISVSDKNTDIKMFFEELHILANQHNKNIIPFDKFLLNFLLLLQNYILPIITFQRRHVNMIDKLLKEQSDKIEQLRDEMKYEETILSQNIDYFEMKINEFKVKNIDDYSEHFRKILINSVDILTRDIGDKLQCNQQEIDDIIKLNVRKQLDLSNKKNIREELFKSLTHLLKINDTFKQKSQIQKIDQSFPNIQEMIHNFEMTWNEFIIMKNNFKSKQEQLKMAKAIKEELVSYFEYLKDIKFRRSNSVRLVSSSQFCQPETEPHSVAEEMESLLSNPTFSFANKHQQFVDNFLEICKIVGQNEEFWVQENINFDQTQTVLIPLWQQELKNNIKLGELLNIPINEISKDYLLKGLKIYFQDHILEMCHKMLTRIHKGLPSSEGGDTALQFLWQCYEKYLSSERIFLALERLFRTVYHNNITKLKEILKNPNLIKVNPDLLQGHCSDQCHNHYISTDINIESTYECLDFRVKFDDVLTQIRTTSFCLSFSDACNSLKNCFNTIEKKLLNPQSATNVDDILLVIEFLYLHCKPELFIDFYILLQMLDLFLPSFISEVGKTGHCFTTFYGVYKIFLENYLLTR